MGHRRQHLSGVLREGMRECWGGCIREYVCQLNRFTLCTRRSIKSQLPLLMGNTDTTCPMHDFDSLILFGEWLGLDFLRTHVIFFDLYSAARAFIWSSFSSILPLDRYVHRVVMISWMTILIYLQAGMTGLKLVIPEQSAEQLPNFTELGKTRLREEYSKK